MDDHCCPIWWIVGRVSGSVEASRAREIVAAIEGICILCLVICRRLFMSSRIDDCCTNLMIRWTSLRFGRSQQGKRNSGRGNINCRRFVFYIWWYLGFCLCRAALIDGESAIMTIVEVSRPIHTDWLRDISVSQNPSRHGEFELQGPWMDELWRLPARLLRGGGYGIRLGG